jgi:hypothetical protein
MLELLLFGFLMNKMKNKTNNSVRIATNYNRTMEEIERKIVVS